MAETGEGGVVNGVSELQVRMRSGKKGYKRIRIWARYRTP